MAVESYSIRRLIAYPYPIFWGRCALPRTSFDSSNEKFHKVCATNALFTLADRSVGDKVEPTDGPNRKRLMSADVFFLLMNSV